MIIDADLHNIVPDIATLLPYMDTHWREYFRNSRFKGPVDVTYPIGAETSIKPGLTKEAGSTQADVKANLLDPYSVDLGILNCTYEVDSLHNPDMAAACARAVNAWQAERWLAEDQRLRSSIVVPSKVPVMAAQEIEHWGKHPGFVQVILPARSQHLYGTRNFWPVLEAAVRHDLAICIHYGGASGYPSTPTGWPSWHIEEYVGMAQVFQSQIINLIVEGVFAQFPSLRIVMAEGGWTWLPSLMWRLDKEWKGLRFEIPWVNTYPSDLIRKHMRFTLQPIDAPPSPEQLLQTLTHLESDDLLLFSSDYPHWHDSPDVLLHALNEEQKSKIMGLNAKVFYGL
ncbi:MAG: amidohydrolase family protein [Chloroflexota bacterium]